MSDAREGGLPVAFELQEKSRESKIGSDEIAKTLSSLPHPVVAKPSGLRMPSPKIGFFDGVSFIISFTHLSFAFLSNLNQNIDHMCADCLFVSNVLNRAA